MGMKQSKTGRTAARVAAVVGVVGAATIFGVGATESERGGVRVAVGVSEARADDFGFSVLKCFHPTATYVGSTLGQTYTDPDGRTAANGHIDFRGGFTGAAYSMDFVMHTKTDAGDKFIRITPGRDTAPTTPNPNCSLRNWSRTN